MRYIATRPRAEKHGKHGLFGSSPEVSLEDSMKEALRTQGPVWTFIYSLKREDAARLGYDSAESWRRPIMAHQVELAEAMKIPPSQFRWCAAFHGESHHPHIHMMVWSDDPKLGYLTEDGIEKMRSTLTNDIFSGQAALVVSAEGYFLQRGHRSGSRCHKRADPADGDLPL